MIVYHGGGYVGMTGAMHFAMAGETVVIYDPDPHTVDGINAGTPRTNEFLAYLNDDVKQLVDAGKLRATTRFDDTHSAMAHIIAVPTERDGEPFDGIITKVIQKLYATVPPGAAILVESTLVPGTIDTLLEEFDWREIGSEVFLAVCPRRDWFADRTKNVKTIPRIVGGVTAACTREAHKILSTVSDTILTTTYRTAEVVKSLENALLHVPMMLGYQLATALPDRDIAEALRLAGTHWRLMQLYLGFGSGGRCVPLGTKSLVKAAGRGRLSMGEQALSVDDDFRMIVANHVAQRVGPTGKVLILGIAYRPEFRDAGLSPGLAIARRLHQMGVEVFVHDPLWTAEELDALANHDVPPRHTPHGSHGIGVATGHEMRDFDAVLLATPHDAYAHWPLHSNRWRKGQYVLDGQGTWSKHRALFEQYGVRYAQVGTPGWLDVKRKVPA